MVARTRKRGEQKGLAQDNRGCHERESEGEVEMAAVNVCIQAARHDDLRMHEKKKKKKKRKKKRDPRSLGLLGSWERVGRGLTAHCLHHRQARERQTRFRRWSKANQQAQQGARGRRSSGGACRQHFCRRGREHTAKNRKGHTREAARAPGHGQAHKASWVQGAGAMTSAASRAGAPYESMPCTIGKVRTPSRSGLCIRPVHCII